METIKQAAVKIKDTIYTLPRPYRHGDIYPYVYRDFPQDFNTKVDGFITDTDRFVDRAEAAEIALKAHQIISDDFVLVALYTEDIF